MIIHRLQTREPKQQDLLSHGHHAGGLGEGSGQGVEEEPFDGVVVERSERVRDVETVVVGVEVSVEPGDLVHEFVEEELPGVDDEAEREEERTREGEEVSLDLSSFLPSFEPSFLGPLSSPDSSREAETRDITKEPKPSTHKANPNCKIGIPHQ